MWQYICKSHLIASQIVKQILPATLVFKDIAGLVKGASEGEGLGNQFLAHIREVDALLYVVRCFDNADIMHVAGGVDPVFDKELIDRELQLKDLSTLQKRAIKIDKKGVAQPKEAAAEKAVIKNLINHLEKGGNARTFSFSKEERTIVAALHLLTQKPIIYVANIDEQGIQKGGNRHVRALQEVADQEGAALVQICAALEADIADLPLAEQTQFLAAYQLEEGGLAHLTGKVAIEGKDYLVEDGDIIHFKLRG